METFVGPLSLIYAEGRIKRRSRYSEVQWEEVMDINARFPSHKAEKSGDFIALLDLMWADHHPSR
jgi:hypothetical protein